MTVLLPFLLPGHLFASYSVNQNFLIIAIDGGAASGKSSTSRGVAERMQLMHVDTGSHYRAITHALLQEKMDLRDTAAIEAFLADLELATTLQGRSGLITLQGESIPDSVLRSPEVNRHVSEVAALVPVREAIKGYQRDQASVAAEHQFRGLIMEGRDIGSVIFPHAPVKIYLEADTATRQARRLAEGQEDAIENRDRMDSSRAAAPLREVEGAIVINTARHTLEEVIELVCTLANRWEKENLECT